MNDKAKAVPAKRGPEPERVKIEGMDWRDAVQKALRTPAPGKAKTAEKAKRKSKG